MISKPVINRWTQVGAIILACATLGACASLSKSECVTGDWRTIGFEDGLAGRKMSRIGAHRKACADHGVNPDLDLYRVGREDGLRQYCTSRKGFEEGTANRTYHGVCPEDLEGEFLNAYDEGQELYGLRQELTEEENDLTRIEREIDETKEEIRADEDRLRAADLPQAERDEINGRLTSLNFRMEELRRERRRAERRVDRAQDRLDQFERNTQWP
jgi:hypothetical protein